MAADVGGFWGSIGSSIGSLFEDGGWLSKAFSGANFADTMKGGASAFDAYSKYKTASDTEKFNNKIFGLQVDQYNNSLADQEEEKKRRDQVDNSLASVWG
jgi:hypothetical protein